MVELTKIPWTKRTLDVTGGCTKCATGCKICWAVKEVWRQNRHPKWKGLVEKTPTGLNWTGKIKLFEDMLEVPLRTRKPTKFFVNSKSDLFHLKVPFEYIDKVMAVIAACPQHTFQILTKRPWRMLEYYQSYEIRALVLPKDFMPLSNLWLGPSISTQDDADRMIPIALQIPVAVHIVSVEPMLEVIKPRIEWVGKLQWAIIGTESGPKRRKVSIDAVRETVSCWSADNAVFLKQIEINGKCSKNPSEWPKDLQGIQEHPSIIINH